MQIIPSSGLADEEVDRMVHDAEQHREDDRKRKEEIETRNTADNTVYTAEKFLKEQGDKAPDNVRKDVESKVEALKKVIDGGDVDTIRRLTEELGEALQQMGAAMYQDAGAEAPPPPGGESEPSGDGDEDVVEGEFSEA
jgi:molecular chaperone DnaK